jgi:hypothetical protein
MRTEMGPLHHRHQLRARRDVVSTRRCCPRTPRRHPPPCRRCR